MYFCDAHGMQFDLDAIRAICGNGYLYLATPYSYYPKGHDAAFKDAAKIASWCINNNIDVFSPIVYTHPLALEAGINTMNTCLWERVDRPFMRAARGIIVAKLDGYLESEGVTKEIRFFNADCKPIVWLHP